MIGMSVQHPDENTLELYVLNAPSVSARRAEIESHFLTCEGCRILAERMGAFYRLTGREESVDSKSVADYLLSTRTEALSRPYPHEQHGVVIPKKSRLARIADFTRLHPVVSGGGTVFGLAILSLAAFLMTRDARDTNPSFVHINSEQGMVEVYNRQREKLWQLPGIDLSHAVDPNFYTQSQRVGAVDIKGDGKSDVLCCVTLGGPADQPHNGFSIFSSKKELVAFVSFSRNIRYRGIEYPSNLATNAFVVGRGVEGQRDLYVSALNARSPMVLARLNARGEVLAEYWHFGHLPLLLMADVDGDGKEELILGGVDDTEDDRGGRFPVIVILDPDKIQGVTESPATLGFGKMAATAEKCCIRIPVTDLEQAINAPGTVTDMNQVTFNDRPALSFWVKQRLNGEIAVAFEYIFSRDLQILAVRSSGPSEILHGRLVQERKISGKIDSSYLETLRRGVVYWDGGRWSPSIVFFSNRRRNSE